MNRDIDNLINDYLDGELTDDEQHELSDWIKADTENANLFANAVMLHDRLECELNATADILPDVAPVTRTSGSRTSRLRPVMWIVAASLVVALGVFYWQSQPTAQNSFATVAQIVDVQWTDGSLLRRGDRVGSQSIALQSGVVRLQFDDGVEVTLQGPAQFELVAPSESKLTAGLLTATVPPGAEGFRVETPTAEVVDLGTTFGIELDDQGVTYVSVFDGEVEVSPAGDGSKQLLKEGEAVRVTSNKDIEPAEFDTSTYKKLWPISSGIERSTGAFRFTPPWPRRLRLVQSNNDVFVVPEGYATTLVEPLKVNITSPGEYVHAENLSPSDISSGQPVRSFILHFNPEHDGDRRRFMRTTGSITFDRPVLGLIVLHQELAASAERFPGRRAGELLEHRQLELTGNRRGDVITLSDDRRTVGLDLALGRFSDLVRVIVDASVEQSSPTG